MRKIVCSILALVMLLAAIPVGADGFKSDVPYQVYDISFDDDTAADLTFNLETSYTDDGVSGKALSVTADESGKKLTTLLKGLQKKSLSEVSVWVKLDDDVTTAQAKLIVILTSGGQKSEYVIDKKNVSANSWVCLSGRVQTKFMDLESSPEIAVSVTNGGKEKSFKLDNLKVMSDTLSTAASVVPVPDIKKEYDGNRLERASFETGTLDMFTLFGTGYEITDEAGAHSGKYALKVKDRTGSWHAARCMYNDMDKKTKYTVSLWVKKSPKLDTCKFSVQGEIHLNNGNKEWPFVAQVTVTDNEWHYLEGIIDGSAYEVGSNIGFQISIGDHNMAEYYVDDLVVRADKPGRLYDDMDYVPGVVPEGISTTPKTISPIVKEIQQDIPSLKDVYKDYFKIGACLTSGATLVDDKETQREQLVKKHFNGVVHDGHFKMPEILTKGNRIDYDFTLPDYTMQFAQENGIEDITGHCLFWELSPITKYIQNEKGEWISRDECLAFMKEYATKVIKHFEGDGDPSEYMSGVDYSDWHVDVWDVANEAINAGYMVYANRGGFFNILGHEWVDYGFKFASEAGYDDVKLRYNDFGEQNPGKRQAMYDVVKKLQDKGIRIDSLGLQTHYRINVLSSQVRDAIELFSSLGVSLDMTEADISAYTDAQIANKQALYEQGVTIEAEIAQANLYYNNFQIYKEYADIIDRVVFWTYEDGNSYQNRSDSFNRVDYAGIFDRHYQAKPQFWAIADPEYYFANILNEDTSKVRIMLDGKQVEYEDTDVIEQDGVTYLKGSYLLSLLGLESVYTEGRYAFIANDIFISIGEGTAQSVGFKDYMMNNAVISKDGDLFLPAIEVASMMGFTAEYDKGRNIVGLSSNQHSNNL